ncbi:MAG: right-handed parallel beta-helix repeat-containing protein, partial [Candidatus Peribacteraceae bacterium]|nr:right-handed parallel beta-helix repeat-containing protein [Candidatus Peribacteraceae bacterium]
MKNWGLLLVVLILAMSPLLVTAEDCGGYEVPDSGDWLVNESVTCTDKFLNLNGNILINSSGTLVLENTVLQFNSTSNGEFGLENDGSLLIQQGSTIESESAYAYTFVSNSGATLEIKDSFVHDCGYNSYMRDDVEGVYIESDWTNITNTTFTNNFKGILLYSDNSVITGNNFTSNQLGFYMYGNNNVITGNNISESISGGYFSGDGIFFEGNIIKNNVGVAAATIILDNSVISNNTFLNNLNDAQIYVSGNSNNITNNLCINNSGFGVKSNYSTIFSGNIFKNNYGRGLSIYGQDDIVVKDSIIVNNSYHDIFIFSSGNITFENTTYNRLLRQANICFEVFDADGGYVDEVNFTIKGNRTAEYGEGWLIQTFPACLANTIEEENESGTFYYNPYILNITKVGFTSNYTILNLTGDRVSVNLTINETDEIEPPPEENATFNFTLHSPQNITYMKGDLTANGTLRIEVSSETNITSCSYLVDNTTGDLSEIDETWFRGYLDVDDMEGDYEITVTCTSVDDVENSTSVVFTVYPTYDCFDTDDCFYGTDVCLNNRCIELDCTCGYAVDHECVKYDCCYDSECDDTKYCDTESNTCELVLCECSEKRSNHRCNMAPGYCCSDLQCDRNEVCDTSSNTCIEMRLSFAIPDKFSVGQKVKIMVFDQDGNAVSNVKLTIEYPDTDPLVDMEEEYTNSNGLVEITIKHAGRVEINARKEGYYTESNTGEVSEPFNVMLIVQIVILIGCIAGGVVVYFKFIKGSGVMSGISIGGGGPLKLEKTVSGPHVMLKIRNKTKEMLEGITIRDSVPKGAFIRSRMVP